MGPHNREVKAKEARAHPSKSILLKKIAPVAEEPSPAIASFKKEVVKFNQKSFVKSKFKKSSTRMDESLLDKFESSSPSKKSFKGIRSKKYIGTVTTLNDIPSGSDLAVKKTRKRVDKEVDLAHQIQEKAATNKRRVGLADIFGAELNMDGETLQMVKNTFLYAKSIVNLNKKVAQAHFTLIPLETRLPNALSSVQLTVFEKKLDEFLKSFANLLRSNYILHEPELAMTCNIILTRHD